MSQTVQKKYDFDRVVRMVLTLISVGVGVWLVNYLSPVLMPFVVGFILAYLIEPLVEWLQKKAHIKARAIAVVLALVIVIAVIAGLCWLIIPYLIDEFGEMSKQLAAYAKSSLRIPYVPAEINEFIQRYIDLEKINEMFSKQQWMDIINKAASGAWSVVGGTMSVIFNILSWFIVLLYMFFILLDFNKLSHAFKAAIPSKYRRMALRIFDDVAETMSRYFRGQAAVSFFVGVIFAIEFYIIGLPMAIAFGMFVGLLNMVPFLCGRDLCHRVLHHRAAHGHRLRYVCGLAQHGTLSAAHLHPHRRLPVPGGYSGNRSQFLGDVRVGYCCLHHLPGDPGHGAHPHNHEEPDGPESRHHLPVIVAVGLCAWLYRTYHRPAADNADHFLLLRVCAASA